MPRMTTPLLSSKDNPLVRTMRNVAAQARRAPADLVLAEGLRVLAEATQSRYALDTVLLAESFGASARERALLSTWMNRNIAVRRATLPVLRALSDVVTPQGAVALVRVPRCSLADVSGQPDPLVMCVCGIQDPGNLGALLRIARGAAASYVLSVEGTVSARNPKAIRASAGAFFAIPIVEGLRPQDVIDHCRVRNIPMHRADARTGSACWQADLRRSAAILLGNEARGLPDAPYDRIPCIRVPMASGLESLNVAAAGAILMFEAFRQRSCARLTGWTDSQNE